MTTNTLNPQLPLKPTEANPLVNLGEKLKESVNKAQEVLVLIRDNPKLDHVASGLSLYLGLNQAGKSVTVACTTPMRVEFNRLVGVDKVTQTIGNRNLVIAFPYVKDSIEKVSYHVDENTFNLIIQPKASFPNLQSDKVSYSYSGAEADLVFVVGAQKLEDLGILYQAERQLFDKTTLVNLDSHPRNTKFATLNLVWNQYSSCAEAVTETLAVLGFQLNEDIASNLLAGVNDATQNFQRFGLKPKAFEVAAQLMQAGGKRIGIHPTVRPNPFSPSASQSPLNRSNPLGQSQSPPAPPATPLSVQSDSSQPIKADWLKPKIYKSGGNA